MVNQMKEVMSAKDTEKFNVKHFFDGSSYKKDYEAACKYAKEYGGIVYTMIDNGKHISYEKGLHYVNRLGFAVIK